MKECLGTWQGSNPQPPVHKYNIFFSILDQQQKQAIPFQGGVVLSDFDGRIFVASTKEIYSLVPVAWEKQVSTKSCTN